MHPFPGFRPGSGASRVIFLQHGVYCPARSIHEQGLEQPLDQVIDSSVLWKRDVVVSRRMSALQSPTCRTLDPVMESHVLDFAEASQCVWLQDLTDFTSQSGPVFRWTARFGKLRGAFGAELVAVPSQQGYWLPAVRGFARPRLWWSALRHLPLEPPRPNAAIRSPAGHTQGF